MEIGKASKIIYIPIEINKDKWLKRIRLRSDISGFITHFTRKNEILSPYYQLL